MIMVTIPGKPVAKGRPRFTKTGRLYTPKTTAIAENWAKVKVQEQVGSPLLEGALAVDVLVLLPIPKSWSKAKRAAALSGDTRPTSKPDADNIAKLYLDALNGIMWLDDSQIAELNITKVYAPSPEVRLFVRNI